MAIASESIPVVRPVHTVVLQPPKALKHALGKDNVHISNGMLLSPGISDALLTTEAQNPMEVYLMHHSLHIGQTNLKRCMDDSATKRPIYNLGVPLGNQALTIKASDWYIHSSFHPIIFPCGIPGAIILHGDNRNILSCYDRIVNDDDTVRLININPIQPGSAGKHQTIVCVELAELTISDGHIHLDASAHLVIHILTQKR